MVSSQVRSLRSDDHRADKTFLTGGSSVVHLVESWEKPKPTPPIKWRCNQTEFAKLCAIPKSACSACALKNQLLIELNFSCSANTWDYLCKTGGAAPPSPPSPPPGTKLVTAYSAAASVELLVNGVSVGTRKMPAQRQAANATVVQTWASRPVDPPRRRCTR